jgi:hypothetical protein
MNAQDGSDCLVLVDKQEIKATILHVGRGKFRILNDERNGKFVGRIVDAGDVIHCRFSISKLIVN